MSWTDERVSLLKQLWGEGKTAAEIAQELGGVTRNAVIGKAHRLKLSGRASPIQPTKKTVSKIKPKKIDKVQASNNNVAPFVPEASPDDDKIKVALMDLGAKMCRWPIGDPKRENFGFCGDTTVAGIPYCMRHAQTAYQAATRNRLLKEERAEEAEVRAALESAGASKTKAKARG